MKLNYREDPDAEATMKGLGIGWKVCQVDLEAIDWVASAENCARPGQPLNRDKIEEYAIAKRRGDAFPMIVLEKRAKGLFVIVGGNQRANAEQRLKATSTAAYVVDRLEAIDFDALSRALNAKHGWGTSKQDRINQAIYLTRRHGVSVKKAAELMGVAHSTVSRQVRAAKTRAELVRSKVPGAADLSVKTLESIAKVKRKNDRLRMAEACGGMSGGADVDQLAHDLLNASDDDEAASIVAAFKDRNDRPKTKMPRPFRAKFFAMVTELDKFLQSGNGGGAFRSLADLQMSEKDVAAIVAVCGRVAGALDSLLAEAKR